MTKVIIKRYSEAFKRQVVKEYEEGEKATHLNQKYGIKGSNTVANWVRKYGNKGLRTQVVTIQRADERNQVRELKERVKELETAVSQLVLDKIILEASLNEAEQLLGVNIKKNAEQQSSKDAMQTR